MLVRYRHDTRVMHISGDNFVNLPQQHSHYVSRYVHVWGWATWRRAWRHYDVEISQWPSVRTQVLAACAASESQFWEGSFDAVHAGNIDTWDFQWVLACWLQSGMAVAPRANLVSNIGYREDATLSKNPDQMANLPTHEWQDIHSDLPNFMVDHQADAIERHSYLTPERTRTRYIKALIRRLKNFGKKYGA